MAPTPGKQSLLQKKEKKENADETKYHFSKGSKYSFNFSVSLTSFKKKRLGEKKKQQQKHNIYQNYFIPEGVIAKMV